MVWCKGCSAEIMFITTSNLKKMPCDTTPVNYWENKSGKGRVVTPEGNVVFCNFEGIGDPTGYGYTPHWATCDRAASFKK